MFNIGFSELLVVGVIALIFIGPQQLPEVARTIGRMLNELRRATDDLKGGFTSDVQNTIAKARATIAPEPAPAPVAEPTSAPITATPVTATSPAAMPVAEATPVVAPAAAPTPLPEPRA